ncbi:uncharacterized protein VTP21DRAFT_7986 [Calcarisporiella thermophila]|uniref:uncharacterized protein n=1 Tax=Calcarisporiella thermophila TaxID=911321 RepID=UPI003743C985
MAASFFQSMPRRQRNLIEFKAGKLFREGNTNLVKPDLRKGLVYMNVTEDQLLHFCWKDRRTNQVEEDLIIFPEEAEFVKVEQASNGRVYLLRFKSSSQKHFFWMQDAKADKDEDISQRVNRLINDPNAGAAAERSAAASGAGGELAEGFGMDQDQLLQLLQGSAGFGGFPLSEGQGGQGRRRQEEQPQPSSTSDNSQHGEQEGREAQPSSSEQGNQREGPEGEEGAQGRERKDRKDDDEMDTDL